MLRSGRLSDVHNIFSMHKTLTQKCRISRDVCLGSSSAISSGSSSSPRAWDWGAKTAASRVSIPPRLGRLWGEALASVGRKRFVSPKEETLASKLPLPKNGLFSFSSVHSGKIMKSLYKIISTFYPLCAFSFI